MMGGEEYAKIGYGSPRSRGTKLFSVSGPRQQARRIYEIVLGTPFREVHGTDIAGGVRDGHTDQNVHTRWFVDGFCDASNNMDYPFDYEGIPAKYADAWFGFGRS